MLMDVLLSMIGALRLRYSGEGRSLHLCDAVTLWSAVTGHRTPYSIDSCSGPARRWRRHDAIAWAATTWAARRQRHFVGNALLGVEYVARSRQRVGDSNVAANLKARAAFTVAVKLTAFGRRCLIRIRVFNHNFGAE